MVMMTSVLLGSCNCENGKVDTGKGQGALIGKSEMKIDDGRMTAEALWAMGRIGGVKVSPDGSKILYSVGYYSVPQNKSNRELFVMNADGSGNTQQNSIPLFRERVEPSMGDEPGRNGTQANIQLRREYRGLLFLTG